MWIFEGFGLKDNLCRLFVNKRAGLRVWHNN